MSGYDCHLFIKIFANSKGDISCIPNNEENYISFTKQVIVDKFMNEEGKEVNVKRELRFIDSLRFVASSLDKLSINCEIYANGSVVADRRLSLLEMRQGLIRSWTRLRCTGAVVRSMKMSIWRPPIRRIPGSGCVS